MRKFLRNLAGFACVFSVLLAAGENPDGSCCLPWTLGWLSVAAVLGIVLSITEKKRAR